MENAVVILKRELTTITIIVFIIHNGTYLLTIFKSKAFKITL